jgi:hypothetical protein
MDFREHHPAILAICLVASIGFIGFPTASAEATPKWALSPTLEPGPSLPVELAAKAEAAPSLLFTTKGGTKVVISCEKLAAEKGLLDAEGKSSGTLSLSGCLTKLGGSGTPTIPCEPHFGAEKGVIKSKALKGQLVLHESASLLRLEPQAGTALALVELGEECSIGTSVDVKGTFYAKESNGELEVLKEAHLFEAGPLTSVTALGQAATIDGSAKLSLSGAHSGRWWSGSGK